LTHTAGAAAFAVLAITTQYADVTVNIGYQPIVEPSRVPQAGGTYEKVTGAKINWQKFDGGAAVIAAIASHHRHRGDCVSAGTARPSSRAVAGSLGGAPVGGQRRRARRMGRRFFAAD
jgi:taurine transport system substrate-binding protein